MTPCEQFIRDAFKPPSREPSWRWCEDHVVLDNTSALQGRYSTSLVPFVRAFYDAAQNPETRRVTIMVAAQSTKTQNAINFLLWCISEDPAPTMWVMASQDNCKEFAKKRLFPAVQDCRPVSTLLPDDRRRQTRTLIQFDSMNLILRGSNSRVGLQSDPIRRIICDERREWKPGAIDLLRKRLRTFHNSIEISMGTSGEVGDELHADFTAGSQTFIHWRCPKCGHSQPFRFGRQESPLHPKTRERGGLRWDDDETTRPNGKWNFEKLAASVRYECEACPAEFRNSDKLALLSSWHLHHRNPGALPKSVSLHWSALYMPWADCDWAEIVKEFVLAMETAKRGDVEPLRAFITETLAEPWQTKGEKAERDELLDRCGEYVMGEVSGDPQTVRVLTVDVQKGYVVFVDREWKKSGESRLVRYGKMFGFDELRSYQNENRIKDRCVWIDSGYDTEKVYQACVRFHWMPMKGEDDEYFSEKRDGKSVRVGWRQTLVDPGLGMIQRSGLPREIALWLWCNPWYKSRLYLYTIRGLPPVEGVPVIPWRIPRDVPAEYIEQLRGEERLTKEDSRGVITYFWKRTGENHAGDCELMQLVVADIGGLISHGIED